MTLPHRADFPVVDLDNDNDFFSHDDETDFNSFADADFDLVPKQPWYKRIQRVLRASRKRPVEGIELRNLAVFDTEELPPLQGSSKKRIAILAWLAVLTIFGIWFAVGHFFGDDKITAFSVKSKTVVISLDGFDPLYITQSLTPFLYKLYTEKWAPPYMTPSFPTYTFPNHWTLVTGWLPADHGIVANSFFDPTHDAQFVNVDPNRSQDPFWWSTAEPLWSTARKAGLKANVHMWPGSEVVYEDISRMPNVFDKFDLHESLDEKHKVILKWLKNDNADLVMAYVPNIDTVGHAVGPDFHTPELSSELKKVDAFLSKLYNSLDSNVNLVLLSDHGMAPTAQERIILIDDLCDTSLISSFDGLPVVAIRAKEGSEEELYKQLVSSTQDHYKVYKIQDLPKEFDFGLGHIHSERIAPIWIVPDVGYAVVRRGEDGKVHIPKGVHGYRNDATLMRSLFIGTGPFFDVLPQVQPFSNIEVYQILCNALGINAAPNNGTGNVFANVLKGDWKDSEVWNVELFDLQDDSAYLNTWASEKPTKEETKIINLDDDNGSDGLDAQTTLSITLTTSNIQDSAPERTVVLEPTTMLDPTTTQEQEANIVSTSSVSTPTTTTTKPNPWNKIWNELQDLGNDVAEGVDDVIHKIDHFINDD